MSFLDDDLDKPIDLFGSTKRKPKKDNRHVKTLLNTMMKFLGVLPGLVFLMFFVFAFISFVVSLGNKASCNTRLTNMINSCNNQIAELDTCGGKTIVLGGTE